MLRELLKRLVPTGPAAASAPARAARDAADHLVEDGHRAEQRGDWSEACELYRKAVAAAPGYARGHLNLGIGLEAIGRSEEAAAAYAAALEADPDEPFAHYNLGKLHFTRGAFAAAERHLRAALERRPQFPEAQIVLANVLDARGDAPGAVALFESALERRPDDFGAWFRLGLALRKSGHEEQAETALRRAVALDSANPDAHGALSELYQARGDLAAAARHLEAVLAQRPDWTDGWYNLGHALMRMNRFDEAEAALERVVALDPGRELAYRMRANVLHRAGRIEELLELCRAGRAGAPERFELESFELMGLNFVDAITPEDLFERHRAYGERLERARPARFAPFRNDRNPERRLRIGCVSGEFSYHPVSLFLIPLLERRDRTLLEAYCYSVADVTDAVTEQVRAGADHWRDARAMSETELADAVHRDAIDILFDLAGHSGICRLGVFAQQPAPVQAAWLGYLNTTGLTRIHYRVTDAVCDPPGLSDRLHTEELVRLPHCQWCYRPFVDVAARGAAPFEANRYVTFGSFTQIAKLTASMRALWARILREVPDSRLVIAGVSDAGVRGRLLDALARDGVDRARITLLPFASMQEYFRALDGIDIALDTAPYSGGTTTCDALWMGVPVMTLPGTRTTSRSAASILTSVGLADWIADSPEDYVLRAVQYARDAETLAALRRTLRAQMRASPLLDEERFARDMEHALREMWRRWCARGVC